MNFAFVKYVVWGRCFATIAEDYNKFPGFDKDRNDGEAVKIFQNFH